MEVWPGESAKFAARAEFVTIVAGVRRGVTGGIDPFFRFN
jgi:hypothetical protein